MRECERCGGMDEVRKSKLFPADFTPTNTTCGCAQLCWPCRTLAVLERQHP